MACGTDGLLPYYLYKIFNKKYVGSRDLEKLSLILNFNFFEVVSKEMKEELANRKED